MSRKHYGLPNYLRFYNGEVLRFFNPVGSTSSNLNSLYVSDDNTAEGVYWTAYEKEQFFHYLARHLIHQVEVIASKIKTKSVVQILAYYHLLKRELKEMKRHRVDVSIAKVPVRLHANQKAFTHKFKVQKKLKKLVLIKEIPIAYEVSDRFIEMEEVQSLMLAETERRRNNDENQRFSALLKNYKNPEADVEDGALIDLKIASELTLKLWKRIDKNNKSIEEPDLGFVLGTKTLPKLHFKGVMLLEMLIRAETKKIICKMMNDRINKNWLLRKDEEEDLEPIEFTRLDVEHIMRQKLHNVPDIPESTTEIEEEVIIEEGNEKEQTSDDEENERVYEIEFMAPEREDYIDENTGIIPVSQLMTNQPIIEEVNHTALNSLIQDALHKEEERALTKHDLTESQNHEHILLTALTTFREDNEMVQESMLDIDEAFEILEDGDLDFADGTIEMDGPDLEQKAVQVSQDMIDEFMNEFPSY